MGRVDNSVYLTPAQRQRIVKAYERGATMCEIAQNMGHSTATIWRWIHRHRNGEDLQTRERMPHNGRAPRQTPEHIEDLVCFFWLKGLHNYSAIARRVTPEMYPDFGKGGSPGMEYETVKAILRRRGLLHD